MRKCDRRWTLGLPPTFASCALTVATPTTTPRATTLPTMRFISMPLGEPSSSVGVVRMSAGRRPSARCGHQTSEGTGTPGVPAPSRIVVVLPEADLARLGRPIRPVVPVLDAGNVRHPPLVAVPRGEPRTDGTGDRFHGPIERRLQVEDAKRRVLVLDFGDREAAAGIRSEGVSKLHAGYAGD